MTPTWRSTTLISTAVMAFLAIAAPASATCTSNNHVRPVDIVSDEVNQLFNEKNYKKLNELAAKYEKEKTATFDHVAALSAFYRGIAQEFNACAKSRKSDEEWAAHGASIAEWVKQFPQSNAANLAAAMHQIDIGWRARGSGYSSTVSADGRTLYQTHIADGRAQLERMQAASKNNPAWYAAMQLVALAQGWKPAEAKDLFERAAKIDPYYLDIHYTNAAFFSPQWYGDEEQMRAAINRSTELTKKKMGQTMYARLYWTQNVSASALVSGAVDWKRMKAGFEDFIRIFPESRSRNALAMHACMVNDGKTVKGQLDKLEHGFSGEMWYPKQTIVYCTAVAKNSDTGKVPNCFANPSDASDVRCE